MSESSQSPRDAQRQGSASQPFAGIGAPMNAADEEQIMREAMGASYDFRWVLVGMVVILLLQFGLIGVIWKIAGKKFLVGSPRRSMLEASIESIDDNYGGLKGGEEVKIRIKLDKDKKNVAGKLKTIWFGSEKVKPYLPEKIKRFDAACRKTCEEGKQFAEKKKECDTTCADAKAKKKEAVQCASTCRKQCTVWPCKPEELLKMDEATQTLCRGCPDKESNFRRVELGCQACQPRVEFLERRSKECTACQVKATVLRSDLKKCSSDGSGCYFLVNHELRKDLDAKQKLVLKKEPKETEEDFKRRKEIHKKELKQIRNSIRSSEDRTAYAFVPPAKRPGLVLVKIMFNTGYTVSKDPGYSYVENVSAGRPVVKKEKKEEDPTGHLGFWVMLALSLVIYFLGGMLTGRLSPGVTMKEPATAGVFAGLIYFVFLVFIGGDFSVVIFSAMIAVPAFAGAGYVGGWVGEKWQGTV